MARLYHFSDDPAIEQFVPRPVRVPAVRRAGEEWLNGPLVWAIDDWHQPMYLFPRDCPRILTWAVAGTTATDRELWFAGRNVRMIAHIEQEWHERLCSGRIYRYELPVAPFVSLDDAGMWVSREEVHPLGVEAIDDLPGALRDAGVELHVMPSLVSLRDAWDSTMHVSGIRLRNAKDWRA